MGERSTLIEMIPHLIQRITSQADYRQQFIDTLEACVFGGANDLDYYMDLIYHSIFRERADEYRAVLELEASAPVRDTFYADILDLIAAYESGYASTIRAEAHRLGRPLQSAETKTLFTKIAEMPHRQPLIESGRSKMASRDLVFRDAFHEKLKTYIEPVPPSDYQRFLGGKEIELDRRLQANADVLRRLKHRD